jgi:hypothetical protein
MAAIQTLTRPENLQVGNRYLHRTPRTVLSEPACTPVILLAYDACPALVIVRDPDGRRLRCPREEIYSAAEAGADPVPFTA